MRMSMPFWEDVFKFQCVCVCVPIYLCRQSLICSCYALFQVSQQPGEYLLAEPWANYLYRYLCIFLLCLSVGAFVFMPLCLSPSLSVWLGPISACTSMEMRRWLCLELFLYPLSLSLLYWVKLSGGLPPWDSVCHFLSFSIHTVHLSVFFSICACLSFVIFLSQEFAVVIGPSFTKSLFFSLCICASSTLYLTFIIKHSEVVAFSPVFSITRDWNNWLYCVCMCVCACVLLCYWISVFKYVSGLTATAFVFVFTCGCVFVAFCLG